MAKFFLLIYFLPVQSVEWSQKLDSTVDRVLALYFPQYHEFEANSKYWGKGYTDWVAVNKTPEYNKLGEKVMRPTELGYYDLLSTETRRAQGILSKQYDVDGFLYHHYWFHDGSCKAMSKNIINKLFS